MRRATVGGASIGEGETRLALIAVKLGTLTDAYLLSTSDPDLPAEDVALGQRPKVARSGSAHSAR